MKKMPRRTTTKTHADTPTPPIAAQKPFQISRHGELITDAYYWLREKDNPEVIRYLKAENTYTTAMTKPLKRFASKLYKEILGRIKQTDLSVPTKDGNYFYYERTIEGEQYPIYCRKKYSLDAPEEVLLDVNELSKGHDFFDIENCAISDDDNLLAYTTDTTGYRQYTLHIKDLRTGVLMNDTAERVTSLVWAADNQTLFFTTEDAVTKRSDTLWRKKLGGESSKLYYEGDELYVISVGDTKDRQYITLAIESTDTWETHMLRTNEPEGEFQVLAPRQKGHKYDVEHRHGVFYIRTNLDAKNFRVVTVAANEPTRDNWKEFAPHQTDALIEAVETFRDFVVLHEKRSALNHFKIYDFTKDEWHVVDFPESVYLATGEATPEFTSKRFRLCYESMLTPSTIYDYDMETRERTLLKQDEVLDGYDPSAFRTERLWVTAKDGAKIPLSITYKDGIEPNGNAPLFLYGYGAYGLGEDAHFSYSRLSVMNRGCIYVVAHIRGGDELGEAWHDNGMLMCKKNSFSDFIDCAEYLIANKWTSKDKLVIEGGSAGGLLVGAVVNMRPDLFRAAHLAVPFVDVINTMWDENMPLTVGEYLEWGNPHEREAYDYMRSYSPYDNIGHNNYPAILVTAGLNDSQVMYWEAAKYVAKLRNMKTDKNPLLLKINMDAGHGGASGRYDHLKEISFEYAWLLSQVGFTE